MKITILPKSNFLFEIKPKLDECYICLDEIDLKNGAVLPYKCRHHICVGCAKQQCANYDNTRSFLKSSFCGICRAKPSQYIVGSQQLWKIPYSNTQSIYVPSTTINETTLYRDHIQHMIAHSF